MRQFLRQKVYIRQQMDTKCTLLIKVNRKAQEHNMVFVIVPVGHCSPVGNTPCEQLGLMKKVYAVQCPNAQYSSYPREITQLFKG